MHLVLSMIGAYRKSCGCGSCGAQAHGAAPPLPGSAGSGGAGLWGVDLLEPDGQLLAGRALVGPRARGYSFHPERVGVSARGLARGLLDGEAALGVGVVGGRVVAGAVRALLGVVHPQRDSLGRDVAARQRTLEDQLVSDLDAL